MALVVLSIGLLGIGGLQATSKRSNMEALQRNTATLIAQEAFERIRANAHQISIYTAAGAGTTLTGSMTADPTGGACVSPAAGCTADVMANYDLYQIDQALRGVTISASGATCAANSAQCVGGLPNPTLCITGTSTIPGTVSIAIAWRGMVVLPNATISACGNGNANYADSGVADVLRRVLSIDSYIWEP